MVSTMYVQGACVALLLAAASASPISAVLEPESPSSGERLASCPGYKASNVVRSVAGLTADLTLAGTACNAYGVDLTELLLVVEYQTDQRLHVLIQDKANQVYQVPSEVFTRPSARNGANWESLDPGINWKWPDLEFKYVEEPFSFSVVRRSNGEVLFDTSAASIVFESQYLRLRTRLPESPSLYGLGEHTDPFMLNTTNYTRTIWNRDAYETPPGTNLYGDHPVYFDHRGANGTHGVFLLNSNGMDIVLDNDDGANQYLEYNALGGVFDFYFLSGPSPVQVAQQYSEIVGKSAMMPYWGFGFHQCRYGMQDVYEVAEVVANYSAAEIPLETMWTDIDYMNLRRVFSLDPIRFPLSLMRQLVDTVHSRQQHYVVMVDPAIAYQDYPAYNNGVEQDTFLKISNGSIYKGVVWPGVAVFPDWFHPQTQGYWDSEFQSFFDAETGVNIDALWIDMNEASNFCNYPCSDPEAEAIEMGDPPRPPAIRLGSPRPISGFPEDFQPQCKSEVTFNVNASTILGEEILVFGSSITIGSGDDIMNAVELTADNYPIWSITVDMPANTEVSFQYVRAELDGSYVYEKENRTILTGSCNSKNQNTHDTITTSSPHTLSRPKRDMPTAAGFLEKFLEKRQFTGDQTGLPDRNLITPDYTINNAAGTISNKTLNTHLTHYGGWKEYDTHNIYGAMMSEASRLAMLSRRPTLRPMVITRSTFASSGRQVGHWLGDNAADWSHYLFSIAGILEFGALFQIPMVGSDVCGFAGVTNELLCARWATLGAFSPFYRNHADLQALPHEFYRWPLVAEAARNAITIRYTLLDYFYTAFYQQSQTGTPAVQPMFFVYPEDKKANALQYQYFWGPGIMVAPVTQENSTTTEIYLPDDIFYDYYTHETVRGTGSWTKLTNVSYATIPLYYKGGSIIAQRTSSANTTTELRKQSFSIVIAPSLSGTAIGHLYLDDGESIEQPYTSYITFTYESTGKFSTAGSFSYDAGVSITSVTVLGGSGSSSSPGAQSTVAHSSITTDIPLSGPQTVQLL